MCNRVTSVDAQEGMELIRTPWIRDFGQFRLGLAVSRAEIYLALYSDSASQRRGISAGYAPALGNWSPKGALADSKIRHTRPLPSTGYAHMNIQYTIYGNITQTPHRALLLVEVSGWRIAMAHRCVWPHGYYYRSLSPLTVPGAVRRFFWLEDSGTNDT